jgi:hypothetical protein
MKKLEKKLNECKKNSYSLPVGEWDTTEIVQASQ